jgi:predicted transglutaminase-like cysteine proteinase
MRFCGLSLGWCLMLVGLMLPIHAGAEETATHSLGALSATDRAALTQVLQPAHAPVGHVATVPSGWVDLCQRYGDECKTRRLPAVDLAMNSRIWALLNRVNLWANTAIEPISAMRHWGVINQWDYPVDGKGDCNSYALMKRKVLLESGLPRQALLMTVVRDLHGDGHMVLTIRTTRGDFILDNLVDDIRAWSETGYRFVKRQSQEDPNLWVEIGERPALLRTSER